MGGKRHRCAAKQYETTLSCVLAPEGPSDGLYRTPSLRNVGLKHWIQTWSFERSKDMVKIETSHDSGL